MKRFAFIFNCLLFTAITCQGQVSDREIFINPMSFTPSLSASFSELRPDHFHSGLDFKTGGVTGKEVRAAAAGYIYRISVSPTGFGKAIYIRHPEGYSTVYGHLDHFRDDIQQFVESKQYEQQNYTITLYPTREQFQVNQGDIIALSGNTGGSAGPHLHFEVRESATENPVNPLLFNLGVSDNTRPTIEKIIIYPVTANSSVNNSHNPLTVKATGAAGRYSLSPATPLTVNGLIGFGIKTWDTFDNSQNRCGIYRITVEVDSVEIYDFTCDRFSFSESRYINSHIDFYRRVENNEYLHKAWLEPGNKLSMYSHVRNRGLVSFSDNRTHKVLIRVFDSMGNLSTASFSVKSLATPPVRAEERKCDLVIPYGKAEEFTADGIRIHFPATAFYDTVFFDYRKKPAAAGLLSGVHSVHHESTAINDPVRISVRPDTVPPRCEEKLCLVRLTAGNKPVYAGGEMRFGYVSAEVRSFGNYAVSIDTTPPVIKPSFARGANLTGRKTITATITDNLSGIRSYDVYIDGQWALFEYDAKRSTISWNPGSSQVKAGTHHTIEIKATDNKGNVHSVSSTFTW